MSIVVLYARITQTATADAVFDLMSSITFAIATGQDQEGWAMARHDHWK
jgi:hypothetical protein